jgi:hypothetical protein
MENINKRIALENRRQFSLKAAQTPTMETFREPRTNKTNKKPKPTNQPTNQNQTKIYSQWEPLVDHSMQSMEPGEGAYV